MKAEPQKELRVSSLRPVKFWDSKDLAGSTRSSAVQSPCLCQSETQSLFESSLQLSELPTRSWIKKPVSRQASFVLQFMSWLNWSSKFFSQPYQRKSRHMFNWNNFARALVEKMWRFYFITSSDPGPSSRSASCKSATSTSGRSSSTLSGLHFPQQQKQQQRQQQQK